MYNLCSFSFGFSRTLSGDLFHTTQRAKDTFLNILAYFIFCLNMVKVCPSRRTHHIIILVHICYLPAGRSVWWKTFSSPKTVPCSRPRAQFFPIRTDLGRQITCLFFFFLENYFIRNIFVDFLLQQFHTVRLRLTIPSSKPVLFTEVFKRRDSVFADFKLSNKWFTFHG